MVGFSCEEDSALRKNSEVLSTSVWCNSGKVKQSSIVSAMLSTLPEPAIFCWWRASSRQTNVFADTPAGSFADILSRQDADGAKKFLDTLYQNFFKNHRFLQNPVKDMYYKLFLCLEDARHQQKIAGYGNVESIAETIDDCFTFPE